MRRIEALALSILLGAAVTYAAKPSAASTSKLPIPAGFSRIAPTSDFWDGPWVYVNGTPQPAWHNRNVGRTKAPIAIRLDDGSSGSLSVSQEPCPANAGCGSDSNWITVRGSRGQTVARLQLWAAYGIFDVVPVDLIDGPGDELVIVSVHTHSSPSNGLDLKIWKVKATAPVDITPLDQSGRELFVANYIETVEGVIPCARWRTRLHIDPTAAKPRTITLRADFGAYDFQPSGCHLNDEGATHTATLRRPQRLQFANGHYRLH